MKARNFNSTSLYNQKISIPSHKNGRSLTAESIHEASYCIALEFDPNVIGYTTQPMSFTYECPISKKKIRYTADIGKKLVDGSIELIEIKDSEFIKKPHALDQKIQTISDLLEKYHDITLRLITSNDLKSNLLMPVYLTLYKYLPLKVPPEAEEVIKSNVKSNAMAINELENLMFEAGLDINHAWAFIAQHLSHLSFDLTKELTPNTIISWR